MPPSGKQAALDIFNAISNPVQTAEALGRVALGGIEKIQPGGPDQFSREFEAFTGLLKERFGSLENFGRTLRDDPVGAALDISAITGVGGAALRAPRLAQVSRALDPVAAITSGIERLAKRPSVNTLVKTALDLPKKKGLDRIDELANSFVSRGLNVNRKSLKILDGDIKRVQNAVNDIVDTKTKDGVVIKTTAITRALDDLIDDAGRQGLEVQDLKVIQRMRQNFADQNGAILTPRQVQDLKVGFNKGFKADLSDRFGQVRGKARDKLREASKLQLEELHPQLKELNANEGVMIELRKAIENRVIAIEKKPIIPVRGLVAGGVGGGLVGASGDILSGLKFGASVVIIDKIVTDPRIQVALARAINKANLALAKSGKLTAVTAPAFQAGRVERETFQEELVQQGFTGREPVRE